MKRNNCLTFLKFGIVLCLALLWGGSSLAQSLGSSSYQPTADEIARYGPGFPAYCSASAHSSRPECIALNNMSMPVEPYPCSQTGGYQPGCIPMPRNLSLGNLPAGCVVVGAGVISCIGPDGYPQPYPLPPSYIPPPVPSYIPPPSPPSVYDYRLDTPPPAPGCLTGYSPHCFAIATSKVYEQDSNYGGAMARPSYYLGTGNPEYLEYRVNSPYHGYLYVFVTEADQSTKLLYPNAYSDSMYVNPGRPVDFPGVNANYSLAITEPVGEHKLFFVVLSQPIAREVFESVRSEYELNNILLELGLSKNIYHGYAETAFDVRYVIY